MNAYLVALGVEFKKVVRSRILLIMILFFAFIGLMMGFLMLVAKSPEIAGSSAILTTKASIISEASWSAYFTLLMQMVLVLGVLGPGIAVIWIFGREYSDRVIKDILALPVSRTNIVLAKFTVAFFWGLTLLFVQFAVGCIVGLLLNLDGFTVDLFIENSIRIMNISMLTILLITPVAFITCLSRGYLLPIGALILILIITQFMFVGLNRFTPYFPWAIPGLYSGVAGPGNPEPEILSYFILGITSLLGLVATEAWWKYADHH